MYWRTGGGLITKYCIEPIAVVCVVPVGGWCGWWLPGRVWFFCLIRTPGVALVLRDGHIATLAVWERMMIMMM